MANENDKQYLGDGVYVDFDGYMLILTTEDGIRVLNKIYLEPAVYENLIRYVEELQRRKSEKDNN